MLDELEGAKALEVEVSEPTLEKEAVKQTEPKKEPTVGKTYTDEEFRHELDKALGKGLESINRQLSQRNKDLTAKNTELEEFKKTSSRQLEDLQADLEDIKSEHQEAIKAVDDPDIKTAYTDRATLKKREREAARREKDAEDKLYKAELLVFQQGLEAKAKILHEETGIPIKELEDCKTEDEMEVKALRYRLTHPDGKGSENPDEKGEHPEFDSGGGSGGRGGSDSSFLKQFADGTLPVTQANIDRYNKLVNSI